MLLMLTLLGCTSTDNVPPNEVDNSYEVVGSYLSKLSDTKQKNENTVDDGERINQPPASQNQSSTSSMQNLPPLVRAPLNLRKTEQLYETFSSEMSLSVSVNEMPISDFLHYSLGELLNINYIIGKDVNQDDQTITLNIQEKISPQRLMQLTTELLMEQGIEIKYNDELYFIHKLEDNKTGQKVVTAIGRELSSVPRTSQEILQIVPLEFGIKISIERTLRQLVGVKITPDFEQSALFLQGKREEILRALEFIHLLDAPANRGKHIGLISLTYIDSEEFTEQISLLLESEGIPVATNKAQNKNLVLVPITQIGAIAVFSTEQNILNRVRFWARTIDKPMKSLTKQYFMYHPQYARASDLGDSLSALLGGVTNGKTSNNRSDSSSSNNDNDNANTTNAAPLANRISGVSNENLTLVVDERANAIIFYTSGSEYQALLPLIQKLDVLPRQVMLDITIAEVSLTDEFKFGVEWALKQGDTSFGTEGAFGVAGIGGFGFKLDGIDGSLDANFFEKNDLVKVLSNPTLLVRDGVTANINIGSDISVIGQTTEDPINGDRQTTSSEYRKTGVDITVTPSINAQGIVIMEIDQKISNSVPNSTGSGGNPSIFERSISTEVVAQSGQTIILGGLISENVNSGDKKTPWAADIPVIGNLFKSTGDSVSRTELVMLITPRVIDRTDQWDELTESFKQGLSYLNLELKSIEK
jgi:general secretion pathway protein D